MKLLVDCDVLLDVALNRAPFATDGRAVLEWCERNPGQAFIAWHTQANIYYLLRKNQGNALARQFLRDLLVFVEVAATGTAQAKHALNLPMADFEDALQAAAAVQAGADFIVTRNIPDYQRSPIPAITPTDFLAQAP